jgi:rhodanese-related sulfurtransferase
MVVNVTPQRAQEMIKRGEVEVVDVRPVREWEQGHVPGARLLSLDEVRSNPAVLPAEGVLFVCAGGVRSQTAARAALEHGIQRVYSLAGGTLSWKKAGLPLEAPLAVAV